MITHWGWEEISEEVCDIGRESEAAMKTYYEMSVTLVSDIYRSRRSVTDCCSHAVIAGLDLIIIR